jgi:hypothetical protein
MKVAIIIPVGPGHASAAERAEECAREQTVPCQVIRVDDTSSRGPSWARNYGEAQAIDSVEHLVFLDADDEIHPRFVAACLEVARPNTYVYTDWMMGNRRRRARPAGDIYCLCGSKPLGKANGENFHPVTTLIPRGWFHRVGGFDEGLVRGGEDRAFYTALNMRGCCGMPLHVPLFRYNYSPNSRGARWVGVDENSKWLHNRLIEEFGGIMSPCRSCGGGPKTAAARPGANVRGAQQDQMVYGAPGDSIPFRRSSGRDITVEFNCMAQYRRPIPGSPTGRATGFNYSRHYGRRLVFPNMIWMDMRDAKADPGAWAITQVVDMPEPPEEETGAVSSAKEIAKTMFGRGEIQALRPTFGKEPDYNFVIEAGQRGMENGGVFR